MDAGAWSATVHGVAESRTRLSDFTFTHWRRKRQPTPVLLPGESQDCSLPGFSAHGIPSVGCRLWGRRESVTTDTTYQQQQQQQEQSHQYPFFSLCWVELFK